MRDPQSSSSKTESPLGLALGNDAAVVTPSFSGDLIQSTVITAGGDVQLTLANGNMLSVRREDWPNFNDLLQKATRWFNGRGPLFQRVADFLQQHSRGYFRIIADAGLGKTAIAAELTKRYGASAFFLSATVGRTRPEHALNSISAQLIVRYSLPHNYLPAQAGESSDMLYRLLDESTARPEHRPVVVVIDALDEAEPTPPGHNWLHLPEDLPERTYIILTHRPGEYQLRVDASLPVEDLTITWDDPLQQADIEGYLRRQSKRPEIHQALEEAEPQISADRFVTTLREASQGNFMYLYYVLEDIAQRKADYAPLRLDKLPQGLTGYYDQFWTRMAQAKDEEGWTEWRNLYKPVIALLGAAGEPVTAEWLSDHTGRDVDEIRERALLRWQRFLNREKRDERTSWRLVHQSFADFLAGKEEVELRRTHRSVAEYYLADSARWSTHEGYAPRHLAAHLTKAGMIAELGVLVERRDWYVAQTDYDPSRRTYVRDVERATMAAEDLGVDGVPGVVAWSLLYGTLASMAASIPPEALEGLMLVGKEEQVLRYAELITEPQQQIDAYQKIGELWRAHDQPTEAKAAFLRAREAAQQIGEKINRARTLGSIAANLTMVGEPDVARSVIAEALDLVHEVESNYTDPSKFGAAVRAIAEALYRLGDFDRARHLVMRALASTEPMEDGTYRYPDVRREVLRTIAETENVEHALTLLGQLGSDYERAEFLSMVVDEQASLGEQQGLLQVLDAVEQIGDHLWRARTMCSVALTLSETDEDERAQATLAEASALADGIEGLEDRARALSVVGAALAHVGDAKRAHEAVVRALTAFEHIAQEYSPAAESLASIANVLAKFGDKENLTKTVKLAELLPDWQRFKTLPTTLAALTETGELDQALTVADGIQNATTTELSTALSNMAAALARTGDVSGLRRILAAAEEIDVDTANTLWDRVHALGAVATAMSQAGDLEGLAEAQAAAERIPRERYRAHALAAVATALIKIREKEWAEIILTDVAITQRIEDDGNRPRALSALAEAIAQAGASAQAQTFLDQALELTNWLEEDQREDALTAVAEAMAQVGDRDGLRRMLQANDRIEQWYRSGHTDTLVAIARALAEVDDHDGLSHVQVLAEQVTNGFWRAASLSCVAVAFDQLGERQQARAVAGQALAAAKAEVSEVDRASALYDYVVPTSKQLGDHKLLLRALTVAKRLADPGMVDGVDMSQHRVWALDIISEAFAQMGDFDCAREAVECIGQKDQRGHALATIAGALARTGQVERAIETIPQIKADESRDLAMATVVAALAHGGAIDRAADMIADIEHPFYFIQATSGWADAVAKTGRLEEARVGLLRALETVEQVHPVDRRTALSMLAPVLAAANDKDGLARALAKSELITSESDRAVVLSDLASALAEVGEVDGAYAALKQSLALVEQIDFASWREEPLMAVAKVVALFAHPVDTEAVEWVNTAFRTARIRGRSEVFQHIVVVTPVLARLDVACPVSERIQAVQTMLDTTVSKPGVRS
jgi:tetratricopeptide (TPR) repeat protein